MATKKTTTQATTKKKAKPTIKKKKSKPKVTSSEDMGIVIVDDDLTVDKDKVMEERKAYLEEARSQESSD